jgi:hypothetical protein
MLVLRLILLFVLIVGITVLCFRSPWLATAELHGLTYQTKLDDAPVFRPPPKPGPAQFKGKLSPYLDPKSVEISVSLDRFRLFIRFAALIVGGFFLFGLGGLWLSRRPVGPDVAYSLGLSTGFLGSSLLWVLVGRVLERDDIVPWLPYFWAGGILAALIATTWVRRRATPLPG